MPRTNEQLRDGSDNARLSGASLTSDELAELGGSAVVTAHPVKLLNVGGFTLNFRIKVQD
jgi:hypothetical protein